MYNKLQKYLNNLLKYAIIIVRNNYIYSSHNKGIFFDLIKCLKNYQNVN